MSSQIDVTKPTTGTATTQSVRDNFTDTVSEIEALQGETSIRSVAATVASNALTLALKTSAGIDATSATGIEITFRNATAATGTRTVISVDGALSVVAPQGATLGFANSATDHLYVYALNNGGTVEIAVSASLFDEGSLHTTTAISATADSATVLYSTVARTSVGIRVLGRVKIATGATAGDWSAAPTEIQSGNTIIANAALPKAGGTMTGVIAGFESTGIDDNATSTAITIDASENVLIGKTSSSLDVEGTAIFPTFARFTRSGAPAVQMNRQTSDGDILDFRKDGTAVGSIDVTSTGIGIYLGGTAAANKLDDYEEGTWSPVISDGTYDATAYSAQSASYTKTGNKVHVQGYVATSNIGSIVSNIRIRGLPFVATSTGNNYSGVSISYGQGLSKTAGTSLGGYVLPNNSYVALLLWDITAGTSSLTASEWSGDGGVIFSIEYESA